MSSLLFSPYTLRGVTLRNRVGVAPMCQYSSEDGFATDWHLVHLGTRAVGGAGLIISEATAVDPRGRITPNDLGIWSDAHIEPLARVTRFIKEHGAVAGIQLQHAGRKASTYRPWAESRGAVAEDQGGWQVLAPSELAFNDIYPQPRAMTLEDIQAVTQSFVDAACRALDAGFEWLEIHAAHGYLLNQFMSPLSNTRTDDYGGSFDNRIRLLAEITEAIRRVIPDHTPLTVRISATDWVEGGWTLDDSVELAKRLKPLGMDLIDVSTGGLDPRQQIQPEPGYQVPFSERIRREADIPTAAVGLITDAHQAETILQNGQADLAFLARKLLNDPYWPLHAARTLGDSAPIPSQYLRGF